MNFQELSEIFPANKPRDYLEKYEHRFLPYREDARTVFEIGIKEGGSLQMWQDYFPCAKVIGLDTSTDFKSRDRISVVIGDQSDGSCLSRIAEAHQPFDIIIDDGSHRPKDFWFTFRFLFHFLRPGGLYVIEDMGAIHHPSGWPWIKEDAPALVEGAGDVVREYFGRNQLGIDRMELGRHVSFFWRGR